VAELGWGAVGAAVMHGERKRERGEEEDRITERERKVELG
jgi:hypothetical protein